MRDWRGIKAVIGDRVFYVMVDGTHKPEIHEAWVEEADESHILVRSTASAFGEVSGNGRETRRRSSLRTSLSSRAKVSSEQMGSLRG